MTPLLALEGIDSYYGPVQVHQGLSLEVGEAEIVCLLGGNASGKSTFVKFHWRPKLGLQSTIWDETVKIAGADPDFHRRDMFEAISAGDFPEWELAVQLFSEEDAEAFPFDHLDPTKLIPEELVPLQVIGRMVLNRWPNNFFAETEQVAFCPSNIVPGMDFTNDPLLQGRLFSYLDTQLSRLGSPNFHQIPINAPKCPFANHQRDAHMQMAQPTGRVSYEPNTLAEDSPREQPTVGFHSVAVDETGAKGRIREERFADHYSQARQFYRSQTSYEQAHLASALVFELSKVEHPHIRQAMVGHLRHIEEDLAQRVADRLAGLRCDQPADLLAPRRDARADLAQRRAPLEGGQPPGLLERRDGGRDRFLVLLGSGVVGPARRITGECRVLDTQPVGRVDPPAGEVDGVGGRCGGSGRIGHVVAQGRCAMPWRRTLGRPAG